MITWRWITCLAFLCSLGAVSAQSYTYDDAGRLTRAVYATGGGVSYRYDAADNLLAVVVLRIPPAPAEVSATRLSETTARVNWPATQGASGYVIERREEGSTQWVRLATVGAAATSFIDTTLEPAKRYVYRVAASGADGTSVFSGEAAFEGIGNPLISAGGVVNAASFEQRLAPGAIVSIFGGNLGRRLNEAGVIVPVTEVAGPPPLPAALAGYSVDVDGRPARMYFVGAGQINVQLPWSTPPGARQLIVRQQVDGQSLASTPATVNIAAIGPAIFTLDPGGRGKAVAVNISISPDDGVTTGSIAHPVGAFSFPSQPAPRGGVVILYATGLGAVEPPVADGADSQDQLRLTTIPVNVFIGGARAEVLFSGLAPAFPGVNQLNVRIPLGAVPGDAVPIRIEQGGLESPPGVTIAVK